MINPQETLIDQVTGENCLSLDPETQTLEAKRSIAEMMNVAQFITELLNELNSLEIEPGDEDMDGINTIGPVLTYGIRLMIGIRQITYEQNNQTTYLMLPFEFEAILLPDEIAFPPLRWLFNRPHPVNARNALGSLLFGRPRE